MKRAIVFTAVVAAAALAAGGSVVGAARAEARPTPTVTVLTSGLENPRGLTFGPDGRLYVAEGGAGGTASTIGQCISQAFPGNANWQGPTGIVRDGENFYLVNLNPFAPGSDGHASLWKLTDDGQLSRITSGLTAAVGVAVHDGQIYALEAFTGFFAPAPSVAHTGMVVRLNRHGGWDPVVTGLSFPTAMTFGPDGNLYISNNGFGQPTNTGGEILRVDLT